MSGGAAVVLQARLGLRRLPGKVLATIAGRPILQHCVERLLASGLPVVLATTMRPEDDAVAREGQRLGIAVVRGPDEDVLGRYVQAAVVFRLAEVVRATADNPAVDVGSAARVLDARRRAGADYVVEEGLPYGTTVEAISTEALVRQAELTCDPRDREHVTAFARRDARFRAVSIPAPEALRRPDLRLTVDTQEDLAFVRQVLETAERACAPPVPLAEIIAVAERLSTGVA